MKKTNKFSLLFLCIVIVLISLLLPFSHKIQGKKQNQIPLSTYSTNNTHTTQYTSQYPKTTLNNSCSENTFETTFSSSTTFTEKISETKRNTTTLCENETTTQIPNINSESYPLTYSDNTCSITIEREWFEDAWCYIATLKFTDYDRFGTAPANGKHLNGFETTSHFAKRYGAILAINGDYACPDTGNTAIRSGNVYTDKLCTAPAVYNAHTGVFDSPTNLGIYRQYYSTLVNDKKMTDTFTFWSWSIVENGKVITFDDNSRTQRTFIGSNSEQGNIIIVVSEGRYADGKSVGLTLNQCGRLMKQLGCTTAVPLDGGGSSTLYFNGKIINSAKYNERPIRDFVYFK